MKTQRKISVALVIAICLMLAFTYNYFYRTPMAKNMAKTELEIQLMKDYPLKSFIVTNGVYDYKKEQFEFTVTDAANKEKTEQVAVTNYSPYKVIDDSLPNLKRDDEASARIEQQAARYLNQQLKGYLTTVHHVQAMIDIQKNTLAPTLNWKPEMVGNILQQPTYVVTLDASNLSTEGFYDETRIIYKAFQQQSIAYKKVITIGTQPVQDRWQTIYKLEFKDMMPTLKSVHEL